MPDTLYHREYRGHLAFHTSDPAIGSHTLRWKIAAIPLVEEASLRSDPVVAAADLWAFTIQQSDFLTRGAGQLLFWVLVAFFAWRRSPGSAPC